MNFKYQTKLSCQWTNQMEMHTVSKPTAACMQNQTCAWEKIIIISVAIELQAPCFGFRNICRAKPSFKEIRLIFQDLNIKQSMSVKIQMEMHTVSKATRCMCDKSKVRMRKNIILDVIQLWALCFNSKHLRKIIIQIRSKISISSMLKNSWKKIYDQNKKNVKNIKIKNLVPGNQKRVIRTFVKWLGGWYST